MSEDLLCAACGGRVAEAGCGTCRASRQWLREQRPALPAGPLLLLALLLLVALVLLG